MPIRRWSTTGLVAPGHGGQGTEAFDAAPPWRGMASTVSAAPWVRSTVHDTGEDKPGCCSTRWRGRSRNPRWLRMSSLCHVARGCHHSRAALCRSARQGERGEARVHACGAWSHVTSLCWAAPCGTASTEKLCGGALRCGALIKRREEMAADGWR